LIKRKLLISALLLPLIMVLLEYSAMSEPEKRIMEINLRAVHKNTPLFERSEERKLGNGYLIRMIKIRDNDKFGSLPDTEANVLYYGEVKLGSPARTHGVLIDFEGKEKLLWVDSDADNNYAGETCYQVFKSDRVPGINYYFSPTPIDFLVAYEFKGRRFESLIQFDLPFLAVSRTGYQDLFFLATRSWFTGSIQMENNELRVAVVDTNDNGLYSDPEDLLIIDEDYDLGFSYNESNVLAKTKIITLQSERWNIDYQFLPEKLILTER
jgi:hypothetical protein